MKRWDTLELNFSIKEWNTPINLTWSEIKIAIWKNKDRTNILYNWVAIITNALLWEASISIPSSETTDWWVWNYYIEAQVTDSNNKVYSSSYWNIIVEADMIT